MSVCDFYKTNIITSGFTLYTIIGITKNKVIFIIRVRVK